MVSISRALIVFGLGCCLLTGCAAPDADENKEQAVETEAKKSPAATPPGKGDPIAVQPAERIQQSLEDFKARFMHQELPASFWVDQDYATTEYPKLNEVTAARIMFPDGDSTDFKLENFGALAIHENSEGNYEVISVIKSYNGVFIHLNVTDAKLKVMNSFELARRQEGDGAETIKWGKFSNEKTYHYTYVMRNSEATTDSIEGTLIVPASGKLQVLREGSVM